MIFKLPKIYRNSEVFTPFFATRETLERGRWRLSQKVRLDGLLAELSQHQWETVKSTANRTVYTAGPYFLKVSTYESILSRLKRIWRDKSIKDWDIGSRLFACCGRTPEPIGFCRADAFSIFINRSAEPCETLGEFIIKNWPRLGPNQRCQLVDGFSQFLLDLFRCGLFQTDYNLGNLLVRNQNEFLIIDMQNATQQRAKSLSPDAIATNLVFLYPCFENIERRYKLKCFINLTKAYPELRNQLLTIQAAAYKKMRRHWMRKAKKRIVQQARKRFYFNTQAARGYATDLIAPNIRGYMTSDPEKLFHFTRIRLKDSRRAKLAIIEVDGKKYFLKRYNVKNWRHRLKKLLGISQARKIWLNHQQFKARGIRSTHLIAAVDVRKGLAHANSYALYEYLEGAFDSVERIQSQMAEGRRRRRLMKILAGLAWKMHQKGIYHRDLKISNIIWKTVDKPHCMHVIDLDAVKFRRSVGNRQRLSDLKNMAAYFWMLDSGPRNIDLLFDAYVDLYPPWQNKRDRLHRSFRNKAFRQYRHRLKRDRLRASP